MLAVVLQHLPLVTDSGEQTTQKGMQAPTRRLLSALLLVPCAALACSIGASAMEPPDADTSGLDSLPLLWPVEVGVASFVTQSPAESGQPYPCGSGVNGRHILHDEHGVNKDYLESLDIIAGSPHATDTGNEGRGTDVVAVAEGRVVALNHSQNECDRPFGAGNYMVVEHPQMLLDGKPLRSAYMHLNSNQRAEDQASCGMNPKPSSLDDFEPPPVGTWVRAGQKLGELGNTGNSTGPHLHFQFATDCTLEPASEVDCPSIGLLAVSARGFDQIQTRRDEKCRVIATGGPSQHALSTSYLTDGTYVTSLSAEASKSVVAVAGP